MAKIIGSIPVMGLIAPNDSADTYAVTDEKYGKGGYRSVANISERDNITTERRTEGMLVKVLADGKFYTLSGGVSNSNWIEQVMGGSTGGGGETVTGTSPISVINNVVSISEATALSSGSMSAADKDKLNKIATGAEVNVQSDWNQSVNTADDYIKNKPQTFTPSTHNHAASEITSGTIPTARLGSGTANNTTFLRGDNTWQTVQTNTPTATSSVLGGIKLLSDSVQSVAANPVSSTSARTYGIQFNGSSQAVVNVPWTDTNTTYTFASGTANGAFQVTPSGSSAVSVAIYGLGTAAYTDSTDYASSSHTHAESSITFTDVTTNNASTTKHGYLPKLDGATTKYLNGNGGWTTPPDTNTTYNDATTSASGLMSSADKTSFDVIKVAVDALTIESKQLTGFTNPEGINLSYDGATRMVTLTGDVKAYYKGVLVPSLVSGWVSAAHEVTTGTWFLFYNGSSFVWQNDSWTMADLMIALVYRDGVNVCVRECHGLMDSHTHEQLHYALGTTLRSGGNISGIVVDSTAPGNRRPDISEAKVVDEDLTSNLDALTNNVNNDAAIYSKISLTTNTGIHKAVITNDSLDIINLSGSTPQYNQFNGTSWVQASFPVNAYGKIFVLAIPTSSDANCKKNRFLFVQPQTVSTTLSTIQAVTPSNVSLAQLSTSISEFIYIGEIIVRFTSGDWVITSTAKITGTKFLQALATGGGGISSVFTDSSLTGDGSSGSPLSIAANGVANAKLASMAANTIKGSLAGGTPVDLTASEARTAIGVELHPSTHQVTILDPSTGNSKKFARVNSAGNAVEWSEYNGEFKTATATFGAVGTAGNKTANTLTLPKSTITYYTNDMPDYSNLKLRLEVADTTNPATVLTGELFQSVVYFKTNGTSFNDVTIQHPNGTSIFGTLATLQSGTWYKIVYDAIRLDVSNVRVWLSFTKV